MIRGHGHLGGTYQIQVIFLTGIGLILAPRKVRRAHESIPANEGRDLAYPGATFTEQQRAGYPDLASQRLAMPPAEAFAAARAAGEGLGWSITFEDPATGHLEATDTTRFFRFVDDIVIRVRPDGNASIVDVRSKSRDGQGDLGANAARIRALQAAL